MSSFDENQILDCDLDWGKDFFNLRSFFNERLLKYAWLNWIFLDECFLRFYYDVKWSLKVLSFPFSVNENEFLLMERVSNLNELSHNFFKGVDSSSDIDETFLKKFGYIKSVWSMVVVIHFKLLFLIYSTFQKLAVDLFFGLNSINDSHGPAVDDEDGVLRECKQESCLRVGVFTDSDNFLAEEVMWRDINTGAIPCLPESQSIVSMESDDFKCFLLPIFEK